MIGGVFWAYDSSNLIGTPPRLYNQILRKVMWEKKFEKEEQRTAEFVRLFALVNAAMTDAGIFAWREKYLYEFWRPLSGVREHDPGSGPDADCGSPHIGPLADPFWLTLGAPSTNTNDIPFKPPFPAYPSGHATFGAAGFQMMRRYYKARDGAAFKKHKADDISFSFVSDELNNVSRILSQPYDPNRPITEQSGDVRTRVVRKFPSLWSAIFENAISRIWLGVHWRFDAFAAKDALVPQDGAEGPPYQVHEDGTTAYRDSASINYMTTGRRTIKDPLFDDEAGKEFPIGGVPLGLGIADEIFDSGFHPSPFAVQPDADATRKTPGGKSLLERSDTLLFVPKSSQTSIR